MDIVFFLDNVSCNFRLLVACSAKDRRVNRRDMGQGVSRKKKEANTNFQKSRFLVPHKFPTNKVMLISGQPPGSILIHL